MESRPKEARRRLQKAPNIADSRGDESPIYGERWLKRSDGRRNDLPKGVSRAWKPPIRQINGLPLPQMHPPS
jgi:hypothetical protein